MVKVEINGKQFEIINGKKQTKINGKTKTVNLEQINSEDFHLIINDRSVHAKLITTDLEKSIITLLINDRKYTCQIVDRRNEILNTIAINSQKENLTTSLRSPMPGLIEKILVNEGQDIKENTSLLILNAMKMENTLKATKDGKVEKIFVREGEQVEKGKELLQF